MIYLGQVTKIEEGGGALHGGKGTESEISSGKIERGQNIVC